VTLHPLFDLRSKIASILPFPTVGVTTFEIRVRRCHVGFAAILVGAAAGNAIASRQPSP
jgi:hypothetical protein